MPVPRPAPMPYPPPAPQPARQPYPQPMPAPMPAPQPYPAPAPQPAPLPYPPPTTQPIRYRVHHTYIWLGGLRIAFSLAIAFFAYSIALVADRGFAAFSEGGGPGAGLLAAGGVLLLFALAVALVFIMQRLSHKHLWYELGDEEFSLYSGILNKKKVHVPYQRVQSVNQQASLIQRILGVCVVHIDTAGGASNKAVVVPYLRNVDAEWLRAELFARKHRILSAQAPATAGAAAATTAASVGPSLAAGPAAAAVAVGASPGALPNVLDMPAGMMADVRGVFGGMYVDTGAVSYEYGLSNKELVLTGLSNNTSFFLVALAVLGSIAGIVGQFLTLPFGPDLYDQGISIMAQAFAGNLVFALVAPLVMLVLIVWVASVVSACVSYGGFKACRRQDRIEVEHGLLQHRFHGVDIDRVQSVIVKQSFIRRLIGYCEVSLGKIDAVATGSQDKNQATLNQKGLIVHPFVKTSKVPEILAGLVPEFADVPTEAIGLPRVALRRALIRHCILKGSGLWAAVAVAVVQVSLVLMANYLDPDIHQALPFVNLGAAVLYGLCALVAVGEAVNAVLWYKGSGFAFNSRFMQISNGGFSCESVSFPRKKIQYGYTRTTPFQRAAKVATVNARTAAGIGGTTMSLVDARQEDARSWLSWLLPRPGAQERES